MKPDEKNERADREARYEISDADLVARVTAAPGIGGSLLLQLVEYMAMRMKSDKIEAWRQLGDVYLQDAQQPELSMRSRADAAFDACYMYACCVVGEHSELYKHPDAAVLTLACAELGWRHSVLRPVHQYLHRRFEPLRDGSQFSVLMALALRLKEAAGALDKASSSK